jgi:adenylyl- and sulfurtransferase ThiI
MRPSGWTATRSRTSLLSGGFDSAAAAWYLLRRGVPVHFVHAELACAQTDHALAVARELTRMWAPATDPVVWVLDFNAVRAALLADVPARVRQVRLKEHGQGRIGTHDLLARAWRVRLSEWVPGLPTPWAA